jgi:tail tube protein
MARAQGARAQMALAFETVYGTAPASGYTRVPFASTSLGSEQPLITSELLGYCRDPLAPNKDAVTADGDVIVPIDAEAFGYWLKAAFGEPITSGTGPWTHEFRSGGWTLPSMSIETAMPEVPRFAMYSGCVLDQLSWQLQRSGLLTATAKLVAQGETVGTTTAAGTPSDPALKRFGHFNGSITRNGSALGNVVSAEITYANNLDRIETIRSDGRIDGADPSIAALTGRVEVRFADQVLVNQAIAGDPCELEFGYALPIGRELHLHRARRLPAAAADRDRRPSGGAGDLRLAGRPGRRHWPHVHRHACQRHRGVLTPRESTAHASLRPKCGQGRPLASASAQDHQGSS